MVRSSQTLVLACTLAFSACCDESWGVWEPGNEVNISACSLGAHKGTLGAHISLIPRPFPPPVFNRLQYKNGGEGLGSRLGTHAHGYTRLSTMVYSVHPTWPMAIHTTLHGELTNAALWCSQAPCMVECSGSS